jgi:hypothetical protein
MTRFLSVALMLLMSLANAGWAMEFSAEQTTRIGKRTMTGKIYFQPDRWRVEMASAEGPKISINRLDKAVTWLLLPNRSYVELPLRIDQVPRVGPRIEGEIARKRLGTEVIEGLVTEKYEVTVESDKKREILYQWVAPDIKFAVKTASADGQWESIYSSVTLGPQKPQLFELPAGYTKAAPPQ